MQEPRPVLIGESFAAQAGVAGVVAAEDLLFIAADPFLTPA